MISGAEEHPIPISKWAQALSNAQSLATSEERHECRRPVVSSRL